MSFKRDFSAFELERAEITLIKYLQLRHFSNFLSARNDKERLKSLPLPLKKLHPYVHDGLMHVGGRLNQAPTAFDVKHPIILPPNSHFTELMIRQYHAEVGHSGAGHTWASIRQRYWILKGGAAVRKSLGLVNAFYAKGAIRSWGSNLRQTFLNVDFSMIIPRSIVLGWITLVLSS